MKTTTETNQPKHTQGEWKVENEVIIVSSEHTGIILATVNYLKNKQGEANAQRIVKAVNEYDSLKRKEVMHDELVESVKMLYQLAQQMSEAATKIKFKHDGIEQLLKQAEQK